MKKVNCKACGDSGVIGIYVGEGEFEFHVCEWCGGKSAQRPTPLAPDRAKRAAKSKTSASKRSKSGAAGKA